MISFILIFIVGWEIARRNLAMAIVAAALILTDYQMWVRGGDSIIFFDKTQIEKDLREIQKLEIKNKLEELNK